MQPKQELGGESLVNYFAGMLFDETIAMQFVKTRSQEAKIFEGADKILQENERIDQHLRNQGLYFYEPNGSIFMDYKKMRERKYSEDGSLSKWQEQHVKPTMSAEQAFKICKKEVTTWWDVK